MLSLGYLFESEVAGHFRRNWGKYALGAGMAALAEPEISYHYHKKVIKHLANDIVHGDGSIEEKARKASRLLHHAHKLESANARNLLNHKDNIWLGKSKETPEVKIKANYPGKKIEV